MLFFQISTYHYETIDWDINSFLVTSLEFGRDSIPFENQYENKPPILFGIFYIFSIFSDKNLVLIKLLNDLVISFTIFQTIFIFKEDTKLRLNNFLPPILFILFISNVWFHPSYSEYLSLYFIVSSYLIYKKIKKFYKYSLIGLLVGISSLINLGTVIYLICYILIFFLFEVKKLKSIINLLFGFGLIHLLLLLIYYFRGLVDEYIMSMLFIPISYGTTQFSLLSSITIFLNSFVSYSFYIYILLIFTFSIFIFKIFILSKNFDLNFKHIEILFFIFISIMFFSLAGKGYYHHLIFLLYFVSLTPVWVENIITKKTMVALTIFTLLISVNKFYEQTFVNLENFNSLQENYPIKIISDNIISEKTDYDVIFSTEYILLLYYLDERNSSYIVHPTLYDYEEITSVIVKYGKISIDEKSENLDKEPDIIEGFKSDEVFKNYKQYNTSDLNLELKLLNYWDKDPNINILIRKN